MEKPFLCSQPNCQMTFTNEGRLEVHKRCHEIEINQENSIDNYPTSITMKLPTFIIDQTPTPTNCLKHCEDVSLFPDITLNPFDEEFRKASQFKSQLSIPENSGADSLETPKILPLVDSDETISSTSREVSGISTSFSNCESYSGAVCSPLRNSIARIHNHISGENDKSRKMRLTIDVSPTSENPASPKLISTPTPVITAGPSVSQNLTSVTTCQQSGQLKQYETSVSLADTSHAQGGAESEVIKVTDAKVNVAQYDTTPADCGSSRIANCSESGTLTAHSYAQPNVPSSPATVLQLVLRLPNGQSIPVEIPATPVASSAASLTKSVVGLAQANATLVSDSHVSSQSSSSGSSGTSIAKMKLKQALASCSTAAKPGVVKVSRANTADRIAELTKNQIKIDDIGAGEANMASEYHQKKRRGSTGEDDPLEKRMKFLERNRVAAVRCREKKKKFVKHLFVKSDELEGINQKLQGEVFTLKSEVALLKSLLLQHKDCPITLAMSNDSSGREAYPKSFTTFKIEQPSGVITQVTTTPLANFSPQSQPDDVQDGQRLPEITTSQPKIMVATPFKSLPIEPTKPIAIAPAPAPSNPQHQTSTAQIVLGGNIRQPDRVGCLQSTVSSSSSVILVNHPTASSTVTVPTKIMSHCGSKPSFIISKSAVPVRRGSTNTLSARPSSTLSINSPQCVLSLDPSSSNVYAVDQFQTVKTSSEEARSFHR